MTEIMRTIPYDIDAEEAVIGAVIMNPARYSIISELNESDFYDSRSRLVFNCLEEYSKSEHPDYVVLKNIFEKMKIKDVAAAMQYVIHVSDLVPSTDEHSVKFYTDIIKEKSERRRQIEVLQNAAKELYEPDKSVDEINDMLLNSIFNDKTANTDIVTFDEAFSDFLDEFEERQKNKQALAGLSSGFKRFNIMTGGLEKQKLYVIGGRPAMGKTAFALNIAAHLAMLGKNVALFSLEMNKKEVAKRIISSVSGVKAYKLKTANVEDSEYRDIGEAFGKISDKIIIKDNAIQTAGSITSDCIRWNTSNRSKSKKIDAIIIDYLQLLSNDNKRLDRRNAIGESSRACKIMAKRLDCPVILLSQLSRANESRNDKMPMLSDLRESGDIEQDADVVAFVHRDEYYRQTSQNEGLAKINIAKNRDGEVGIFELKWDKHTTKFSNLHGGFEFENKRN